MTRRSAADWFFVPADDARARRPADAAMGIFGALLVTLTALRADQVKWFEDFLDRTVEVLPTWLGTTFQVIYGIGLIYALIIIAVAVSQWRERIVLIRDLALAIGLVFVLTLLLARLVSGAWPVLLPEVFGQAEPLFPVARVALVTAVLLVAGPELVRPFRRAGWLIVLLMFIIAIALGYGLPGDAIGGLGLGLVSASIVLVVFGSARGFPDADDVKSGLRALGVEVQDVTVATYQRWGARTFDGYTSAGEPIRVGVYGRDAKDAQRVGDLVALDLVSGCRSRTLIEPTAPGGTRSAAHHCGAEHRCSLPNGVCRWRAHQEDGAHRRECGR